MKHQEFPVQLAFIPAPTKAEFLCFATELKSADGYAAFNDDNEINYTARQKIALGIGEQLCALAVWHLYSPADSPAVTIAEAELAVLPAFRDKGLGQKLLSELAQRAQQAGAVRLKVWAHGDTAVQQQLAQNTGAGAIRTLHKMVLQLDNKSAVVASITVDSAKISTYNSSQAAAWVQLNSQVFAWHPEQGRLTIKDLEARLAENWADTSSFYLLHAESGELIGYNWLKLTANAAEIYVLGVAPWVAGKGYGKALLQRGLAEIYSRGYQQAELYVEAENSAAIALYCKYGFVVTETHVQYELAL